jgi:splicing factor 3B subunit 2
MAPAVSTTPEAIGQAEGKLKAKSRNQLRRLKQKQKKDAGLNGTESVVRSLGFHSITHKSSEFISLQGGEPTDAASLKREDEEMPMTYVEELKDSSYEQFAEVFARFQPPPESTPVGVQPYLLFISPD